MNFAKIITAGIAGTSAMTLFSYYLSRKGRKNFREPDLLSKLIIKIIPLTGKFGSRLSAWIIHYLVGILFTRIYTYITEEDTAGPILLKYSAIGGVTGLIAIVGWRTTLNLHPDPPQFDRRGFYGQLIPAHVIFGVVTLLILNDNRIFVISGPQRTRKLEKNTSRT